MKIIKIKADIPEEKHYGALVFNTQTVYHEGDERSRTNPGHGYPAYTEVINTIQYIAFSDRNDLSRFIETKNKASENNYKIIDCKPLEIATTFGISIK